MIPEGPPTKAGPWGAWEEEELRSQDRQGDASYVTGALLFVDGGMTAL